MKKFQPEHALLIVGIGAGWAIARAMGKDPWTQFIAALIGFAAIYGTIALVEYSVVQQMNEEFERQLTDEQ